MRNRRSFDELYKFRFSFPRWAGRRRQLRSDSSIFGLLGQADCTKPLHILTDSNILSLEVSARFSAGLSRDTHALDARDVGGRRLLYHLTRFLLS